MDERNDWDRLLVEIEGPLAQLAIAISRYNREGRSPAAGSGSPGAPPVAARFPGLKTVPYKKNKRGKTSSALPSTLKPISLPDVDCRTEVRKLMNGNPGQYSRAFITALPHRDPRTVRANLSALMAMGEAERRDKRYYYIGSKGG